MNKLSELQKKDLEYVFHPCAQMKDFEEIPPLVIKKGDGLYLIDEDGNRYMDCISSWWVNLFGHCNERINKVVTEQVNTLEHVIFANFAHEPAALLCEELTKVYHGETIGALGVGDVDIFTETYRPLIKEGRKVRVPYVDSNLSQDEFTKLEDECIEELEELIIANHNEIACMIVEPMVQGAAGIKIYSARFLKAARDLTKKYNIHLIDDEIAMGFGRTGKMFACEHAGIEPDMMCIAKGLSSGYYPIAMLCITTKIFNAFYADYKDGKSFLHSHTYSGNPLGCRIALEVLRIFKEDDVLKTVNEKGTYLKNQMEKIFKNKPYVKDIRNIGLIGAIELKDDVVPGVRVGRKIYDIALKKGVFVRPLGNTIYFMPPYVITHEEIDKMLDVCEQSINELLQK